MGGARRVYNHGQKPTFQQLDTLLSGDVMGPSLTGLAGLLDLPVGCGEQNMVNFAPNIFVMQYLNSTNQNTDEIHTKAVDFLRTGTSNLIFIFAYWMLLRIGSCLAFVYRVMDARGKFGEHERSALAARMLSKLPKCIHNSIDVQRQ